MGARKLSIAEAKLADNAIPDCLSTSSPYQGSLRGASPLFLTSFPVFFEGEGAKYDSVMCYNANNIIQNE